MLCDIASGLFVVDVIDVLVRHARNAQTARPDAETLVAFLENQVIPQIAQLLMAASGQPAFVRGVLQDGGPDWTTHDILTQKVELIAGTLATDLARLNGIYGGDTARFLPKIRPAPAFAIDRKAMLLSHVDMREPRVLQRLLYLLLAITNEESSYKWVANQAATIQYVTTAMRVLAQYCIADDPLLSRSGPLRECREKHAQRTLGPVVPTLVVLFDNIAAFYSDPDRPIPEAAAVQQWIEVVLPAMLQVVYATAALKPTSILTEFCDPSRLFSSLPKVESLATMRRDIASAIYPLRRRGGFIHETDLGSRFASSVDLATLCFDHLTHSVNRLAKRIPVVSNDETRLLYNWFLAQDTDKVELRSVSVVVVVVVVVVAVAAATVNIHTYMHICIYMCVCSVALLMLIGYGSYLLFCVMSDPLVPKLGCSDPPFQCLTVAVPHRQRARVCPGLADRDADPSSLRHHTADGHRRRHAGPHGAESLCHDLFALASLRCRRVACQRAGSGAVQCDVVQCMCCVCAFRLSPNKAQYMQLWSLAVSHLTLLTPLFSPAPGLAVRQLPSEG
jgi:hypothetical protein